MQTMPFSSVATFLEEPGGAWRNVEERGGIWRKMEEDFFIGLTGVGLVICLMLQVCYDDRCNVA
jgi:hypothetical protein